MQVSIDSGVCVKVTVEESHIESMDTLDASDSETITLTRNKVWLVYCFVLKSVL